VRHTDVLARLGGDEFLVLLPDTSAREAHDVAEKIRAEIETLSLPLDGRLVRTTVSIGVASYPLDGNTLDLLLAHAEHNMYQAKLAGRNRVYPPLAVPAETVTNA
jgi:diguanylate cyclase (GGDEF)-like protein